MTPHSNIKTKFLIEYDKANVTSSYPSLTDYEIATILNKAYLALIAQKVTGNNPRRAPFEADTKAISDIQELVTFVTLPHESMVHPSAENSALYDLDKCKNEKGESDFLYYVSGTINLTGKMNPVTLISHEVAQKFKQSSTNRPWIKNAVAYIESNAIIVLYDNYLYNPTGIKAPGEFVLTYIREPEKFTQNFDGTFELNDTMAEELISLAVIFSLENVESSRLNTKAQTRGLEA